MLNYRYLYFHPWLELVLFIKRTPRIFRGKKKIFCPLLLLPGTNLRPKRMGKNKTKKHLAGGRWVLLMTSQAEVSRTVILAENNSRKGCTFSSLGSFVVFSNTSLCQRVALWTSKRTLGSSSWCRCYTGCTTCSGPCWVVNETPLRTVCCFSFRSFYTTSLYVVAAHYWTSKWWKCQSCTEHEKTTSSPTKIQTSSNDNRALSFSQPQVLFNPSNSASSILHAQRRD